jgi:hypothetical protein
MLNSNSIIFALLSITALSGCKPPDKESSADTKKENQTPKNPQEIPVSDIVKYLDPQISPTYEDIKAKMNHGCDGRNPVTNKCVLFWTEFNEYKITRGNIQNLQAGDNKEKIAGAVTLPITCQITRHKLKGVTNPDSTDKKYKEGDKMYSASYNVKFEWYVVENPFDKKQNFYISDKKILSEFTSGTRDDNSLADKHCVEKVTDVIHKLNGNPIQYVK